MKSLVMVLAISFSALLLTGCGGGAEEPVDEAAPEAASTPAPVADTEAESAVALPDGFPDNIPMPADFIVAEGEVLNAELKQYKVIGGSANDVDEMLDFYLAAFKKDEWVEDSVMSQKSYCLVSFIKDGLLVFIEAKAGGKGTVIEMTTGLQD